MTRRGACAFAALVLLVLLVPAAAARAQEQGASIAVGAAAPTGDFTSSASTGYDIMFQVHTEPIIGPLALRIDIGLDHFAGKGGSPYAQFSGQAVNLTGDFGSRFYWAAGPGYYQSQIKTQIEGHNVTEEAYYFGTQAAVGVNFPVFRLRTFLEAGAVKLYHGGEGTTWVPIRFGVRL
jgi:hypothetical protein